MLVKVGGRSLFASMVRENPLTMWVQLSNGDIIKRHKRKHLIDYRVQHQQEEQEQPGSSGFWNRVIEFITRKH